MRSVWSDGEEGSAQGLFGPLLRISLYTLLSANLLNASYSPGDNSESNASLYADSFVSEKGITKAYGSVLLTYEDKVLSGENALYDREGSRIVMRDGVGITDSTGNRVYADSIDYSIDKNRIVFEGFHHRDPDDIWMVSRRAVRQDDNYTIEKSIISSCCMDDPDWTLYFDRADYNSTSRRMVLHDAQLYAGTIPLAYVPYLSFSLDRSRSSGLLMPHFGYGRDEGFIYDQPIYWAISESMDLQIDPQVRSGRGLGVYADFRFADSAHSHGELKAGIFHDYSDYTREHDLKNSSHYGVEFMYESDDFLRSWKPEGYEDGLYLNLNLFNDIDYINLQYDKMFHFQETSRYEESRFNYFLYSDERYFGIGARYYIDTEETDNRDTIQEMPRLHYHEFSSTIMDGLLTYSLDATLDNYYKESGERAYSAHLRAPLEFHSSLFGSYLDFALKEELVVADTYFSREIESENHYASIVLNHKIVISSDLVRGYESGLHTILLSATYTKSSILAEGDLEFDDIDESIENDFGLDRLSDSHISFAVHNFWNGSGGHLDIDYLATADLYLYGGTQWNDFRNELTLRYRNWRLYTLLNYSLENREISEFSNKLSYRDDTYAFSINYLWKKDEESYLEREKELKLRMRYRYSDSLTIYGGTTYDFIEDYSKDWEAGFMLDRKCWNIQLTFKQDITPVLKESGAGSIRNNAIYFKFNLIPFGGTGLDKKYL